MAVMVNARRRDIIPDREINLYFFSILPLDFFPSLGIAQIAMSMDPMVRTHLIVARYPRYINPDYFSYFTSVHHLPYFFYQKNLMKGLAAAREFWRAALAIRIQPNSLYFFEETSEPMVHLLLKKRLDRVANILYVKVCVSTEPFSRRDGSKKLGWRRSLLTMMYSLLLGQRLVRMYVSPLTSTIFLPLYRPYHDADIIFDTASPESVETTSHVFPTMSHPAKFVKLMPGDNLLDLEDQAVIYFLAPDYILGAITEHQYWDLTNRLLGVLADHYPGSPLYVKLHPADDEGSLRHLTAPGWRAISKTISPEEIFIQERGRIRAVYSSCSTSSLIAAAFGIPSYVTYPLVLGRSPMIRYWERYFSPGSANLFTVRGWDDLGGAGVSQEDDPEREAGERKAWEECLRTLIAVMRSRVG